MSRQEVKRKKKINCEYCEKELRRGIAYHINEKYFCGRSHYRKFKKKGKKENES